MDSIAIIGLACRFPGEATTAERFWELLCKAKSTHSHITRFNASAFHVAGKEKLNVSRTQEAHFLQQDIAEFDANFFNISKTEAVAMDPQQRIMLEIAYEAFENAGLPLEAIAASDTSCYIGDFTADYREMTFRDIDTATRYSMSGTGTEMISNRISWFYDLRGPSFTLGTACSSSLVALHQGCQSIYTRESSVALVGGCNLLLNSDMFQALSNQQFLADDGCSKSFDVKGNGYGRGEGFAIVILKPVSDAIRDGDLIRAVIRGTGVNHNGKTKGITVPSADAQAALIRSVYKKAGLKFSDTNYFEAHGTGTKAGDPLELESISKTICLAREEDDDLIVGSVKSNIGHLESTAGLAGLIKAIYILERAIIPPNIHFDHPNPDIPFKKWKIKVPTEVQSWPKQGLRRISVRVSTFLFDRFLELLKEEEPALTSLFFVLQVQGFGYGGTNAHAIIDDAYHFLNQRKLAGFHNTVDFSAAGIGNSQLGLATEEPTRQDPLKSAKRDRLFVISSQDQDGLKRQKGSLAQYLENRLPVDNEDVLLRDLSFTLCVKRSHLEWRTHEIASSIDHLISCLRDEASETPAVRRSLSPRIGFVFTGQGSQWARMGSQLLEYTVFRESIEQADLYLRDCLDSGWSIVEELLREETETRIDVPSYSQPICTALQIAIVDLLESWNITPSAIVGHSSGEIAGAYCLGALSKEDALVAAFYRGSLSESIKARASGLEGGMLAAGTSKAEIQTWVESFTEGDLGIACVNSPSSVTLSGNVRAIDKLEHMLKQTNIFARRLKVATAYHSSHMDVIAESYLQSMNNLRVLPGKEDRTMHSSVTGESIDWSELGALNWVRNLVSPVLFYDALLDLLRPSDSDGGRTKQNAVDILLEIGPHATLKSAVTETMSVHNIKDVKYASVLSRKHNGVRSILGAVGSLLAEGVPVRMIEVNRYADETLYRQLRPLIDLPAYSWNHTRTYWSESRLCKQHRNRQCPPTSLLGSPFPGLSEKGKIWRGIIRLSEASWLKDHTIQMSILYPAAGFIAMVIEAARQIAEQSRAVRSFKLRDIRITAPVPISEDFDTEFVLHFNPHLTGTRDTSSTFTEFIISTSSNGEDLRQNCSGLLLIEYQYAEGSDMALECALENLGYRDRYRDTLQLCHFSEEPDTFYRGLASIGLKYGPAFQGLSDIRSGEGLSCFSMNVPDIDLSCGVGGHHRPHIIHPTTLDTMFHAVFAASKHPKGHLNSAMVPKSIDEVVVSANIGFSAGTQFKGFSQASKNGFRELVSDLVVLDPHLLGSVVSVTGFCCAALPANTETPRDESILAEKKIFSKSIWKPVQFRSQHDCTIRPIKDTQSMHDRTDDKSPDRIGLALELEWSSLGLIEITIVEACYPSDSCQLLCAKLAHELKSNHISVNRCRWGPGVTDLAGKHCVSVVDLDNCLLLDHTEEEFGALKHLILHSSSLMWISKANDPAGQLSAGMLRSIRNEVPGKNMRVLGISGDSLDYPDRIATLIKTLLTRSTVDSEFIEDEGSLKVSRIVEDVSMNNEMSRWMTQREESIEELPLKDAQGPRKLAIRAQGMLDTLYLEPDKEAERPFNRDEVEVQVRVSAMNFRDVMVAMGQIPDSLLGFEASGTILRVGSDVVGLSPGDQVYALGHGAHRTVFRSKGKLCQRIPPNISHAEAATIPLVHTTAYYALMHIARVRKGQSILIHSAAGGVGQAALQLANHVGLEIFATVGSEDKRRLIHTEYHIPYDHILNSRDLSFAKGVMRMTDGRGVDCILNSLSGEALRESWHCIAPFGSFIEIGLKDILSNTRLDMQPFLQDAIFTFINLKRVMTENSDLLAEILQEVSGFLSRGILKPVTPVTVYPLSDMETAFRSMQVGKHRGKMALSWGGDDVVPQTAGHQAGPPASLNPAVSYLLVGGLGGLGRSLAGLLVDLGARHLCFISRSGTTSNEAKAFMRRMASFDVHIVVYQCDIADTSALQAVLVRHSTNNEPPIKGAFQCAMALHDSLFDRMTHYQWSASLRPKVLGTRNLHTLLPRDLDFFIILSSFTGIFGNRGQSNYAAANTYQDALAQQRRELGLKAVTVNLGVMREVGLLAEQGGATGYLKEAEIPFGIREREFHSLMRMVIAAETKTTNGFQKSSAVPAQIITGFPTGGMVQQAGIQRPFFFDDPRFSSLAVAGLESLPTNGLPSSSSSSTPTKVPSSTSLHSLLTTADSTRASASEVLTLALRTRLARSLQTSESEIDARKPLHSYGVDSLLAIEMVNWIFKETKVTVSVLEVLATVPMTELAMTIVGRIPAFEREQSNGE